MSDSWLEPFIQQRPKGMALYQAALAAMAGGVGHDMRHTPPVPLYAERASGSRKWDVDGNEYIDYGMGNGALLLGHSPASVVQAIQAALANGFHYGNDHPAQIEWAQVIQSLVPSAERVRFVNSGTEGSMLALRVARAFTGKNRLLRFEGHFSGWHDYVGKGASVPFDKPVSSGIPAASLDTIAVIPADLDVLQATLETDPDIAALMLEPSGGSWGTTPLTPEFNREVRAITERFGVILIYDEVITGFRYSPGGYQVYAGVTPELSVLGKIVTGGMPGGALVGRADLMALFDYTGDPQRDRYERVQHFGTFNANPLAAAAGIATLREVATGQPQAQADRMAVLLRDGMNSILEEIGAAGYVYGDSSVFHVYLEAPGAPIASRDALYTGDPVKLKSIPGRVVTAFRQNLQLRGADLLSYTGGLTSAAHTQADIEQTLTNFNDTMNVLLQANLVARVG